MKGWINGWMNECMNAWMHDAWMHKCMNAWMHGMTWQEITWNDMKLTETQWIKEWRNEWINEGMHEWMNELLRPRNFFSIFMWNRALATFLCTFCRPLYPIEARNRGNRDPPSATTAATLPEKMQGFAPEIVFKPEFTHSDLSHFPTTCMILHDDVVAMMVEVMMWLSSWWETWSLHLFVIRKFPN